MKLGIIFRVIVATLVLGASNAFAQRFPNGYCSNMSKDPKCWENRDNTNNPRPYFCVSKNFCKTIKSLHQDSLGKFHCTDTNGGVFNCNKLVQDFGTNLQGLLVKVTTPYFDGCHIPGGCGPRACAPGYGTAKLDNSCQ